ncbi:alpha-1,2-fucosyltransferase [Prevotella sp. S7-1-8]|uniref:alpha-1,2-fucosyltransferase n=1 Tax=Prevotella sp. S7-1-8 TaxID=1284775 RepID=UPI0005101F21|nr:alpha-1,2-fucosyltransferase [Prevotella sp. S7-1-8]KGF16030.1 alpha-1,2-fucosyltransferase [Prevotella sp. S7-1-8]
MICSYISGRLGNQFFEYAYSRALQIARKKNDKLCFNFELVKSAGNPENGFEDSLQYFNVTQYQVSNRNLVLVHGTLLQKIIFILFKLSEKIHLRLSWFLLFHKIGLLFYSYEEEPELYLPRTTTVITYGKFGNPKAFEFIRDKILDEFTPVAPPLNSNISLYETIRVSNSVCISIRRGDFLNDEFKDDFFVCDKDYFLRAITIIKGKVLNPTFIFFSDDINWVRENFRLDVPCLYESGTDPVWEKLRLMYSCKHFIISNSTFSWWAQYLSRHEEKIVVAPQRWMNNTNKRFKLLSKNFILI